MIICDVSITLPCGTTSSIVLYCTVRSVSTVLHCKYKYCTVLYVLYAQYCTAHTVLYLFIGLILAKWACSLQNLAPTSYWIASLTSQLVRLGLLPGELSPITHMLTLSKLSVLWTFGPSLEGPAPLEPAQAGFCRVLRFNSSLF